MKKMEISQMENLQGGWSKSDSCKLGAGLSMVAAGLSSSIGIGLLGIAAAHFWWQSC